jgi:dipeptidyl-peptidase-4
MVEHQSSVFFGKAGEDLDYRRFGPVNMAAQLAGVNYLKTLPWTDTSRIGLWGWSGGGTHTLYCILNKPGVWRAGVSGAPVTDWKLYDTIWTERYLDRPEDNPDGYRDSSPVTYAANLKDRLLIVHGLADDNVHPQNSTVMSNALIQAGRPFEQAVYPGQTHGFRGPSMRHFYERMADFFERELQGVEVGDVEVVRQSP